MPANSVALKRAAAYLRVSDDDLSVDSIDKQRELIERYAEQHGYQITDWYEDRGISAHSDRESLSRLLTDAETKFDYVIVWKQNRFSRSKPYETISTLGQLQDTDTKLVSTEKGVIDISELTTLIMTAIESEKDHEFSLELSKATIGGQARQAAKGYSVGQQAPYGMRRVWRSPSGNIVELEAGTKAPSSKHGGGVIFLPSLDEEHVDTVRFIYDRYVEHGEGFFRIAEKINLDGIPAPKGGTWNKGTVRDILKNEIYCGDYAWNKRREGKFHSQQGGAVRARPKSEKDPNKKDKKRKHKVLRNNPEDWIEVEDCHEGIIAKDLFKRAQTLMKERDKRAGTKAADDYEYVLTGLMTCAECGFNLTGKTTSKKKKGKKYVNRKYRCPTRERRGKHLCSGGSCSADQLHQSIQMALVNKFRNVELIDRLVDAMNQIVAEPKQKDETERLTARLSRVTKDIERLAGRVAKAPDELVDALYSEMSKLTKTKESIEAQIEDASRTQNPDPRRKKFTREEVVKLLVRSSRQIEKMDKDAFARWLHANVRGIELKFEQVPHGKKTRGVLSQAKIRLRKSSQLIMAGARFELTTSRL